MNTAILSSQSVSLPVVVLAVGQDGKVFDITAAVNCQSTNEDIVKVKWFFWKTHYTFKHLKNTLWGYISCNVYVGTA